MKILLINYEYPPLGGGGGKQSMFLAREYALHHEVYFLTAGWNDFGISQYDGYTIHRIKTKRKRTYRCTDPEMLDFVFKAWKVLPSVLQSFKPDITHIFFTIPTGLLVFHPKLRKAPFVISVRGSDVPFHSPDIQVFVYKLFVPFVKYIWKKAKAIICNSEELKREVLAITSKHNVDIIPNGLDHTRFKYLERTKANDLITLLFVGRLITLKQIDLIIQAMSQLKNEGFSNLRLRITGLGFDEERLKGITQKLQLENEVEFAGDVDYFAIEKEYQNADIYIQVSKVEGMSNTIMEAMACGLPIITSNVGGIKELIHDNGFVLENTEVKTIAQAIKQYIHKPEFIKIHGRQSLKIAENFSWKSVADQNLSILKKCVE